MYISIFAHFTFLQIRGFCFAIMKLTLSQDKTTNYLDKPYMSFSEKCVQLSNVEQFVKVIHHFSGLGPKLH